MIVTHSIKDPTDCFDLYGIVVSCLATIGKDSRLVKC